MLSIFSIFCFFFASVCFLLDGKLLIGSKNLCLVLYAKKLDLKKWSKTFNLLFVVPHKGDPKSIQIDFSQCQYKNTNLSLWLWTIYASESSIYDTWSLVKGLNCANELAVCCVNNIGLWWTTDILQWLHLTTVLPEFPFIPYKLTI